LTQVRGLADAMRDRRTLAGLALSASAARGREITFAHAA
jgi:hypothetical protein